MAYRLAFYTDAIQNLAAPPQVSRLDDLFGALLMKRLSANCKQIKRTKRMTAIDRKAFRVFSECPLEWRLNDVCHCVVRGHFCLEPF